MALSAGTRIVRRGSASPQVLGADIAVLGAGIAGISAAHALDLAGAGAVDQIDIAALQRRLAANRAD